MKELNCLSFLILLFFKHTSSQYHEYTNQVTRYYKNPSETTSSTSVVSSSKATFPPNAFGHGAYPSNAYQKTPFNLYDAPPSNVYGSTSSIVYGTAPPNIEASPSNVYGVALPNRDAATTPNAYATNPPRQPYSLPSSNIPNQENYLPNPENYLANPENYLANPENYLANPENYLATPEKYVPEIHPPFTPKMPPPLHRPPRKTKNTPLEPPRYARKMKIAPPFV